MFQRTPIWCLPKYDAADPAAGAPAAGSRSGRAAARADREPVPRRALVPARRALPPHAAGRGARRAPGARRSSREQVARPGRRATKLTPRYPLGCKRPSFHNEYLATFNRADVQLETTPIERIEPAGGRHHRRRPRTRSTCSSWRPASRSSTRATCPRTRSPGVDGLDLESFWAENRHQAYEGVTVPDFPNYFTMFGPYGYNGSSYFNLVETQARHITRCLRQAKADGATLRRGQAARRTTRYFAEMLRRRGAPGLLAGRAARSPTATTSTTTATCRCARSRRSRPSGAAAASISATTASSVSAKPRSDARSAHTESHTGPFVMAWIGQERLMRTPEEEEG